MPLVRIDLMEGRPPELIEELHDRLFTILLPEEDRAARRATMTQHLDQLIEGSGKQTLELRGQDKAGRPIDMEVSFGHQQQGGRHFFTSIVRDVSDRNDVNHEQNDVSDVELPDPLEQPGGADDEPALQHHLGVDERSGVAGYENEQVGGVAEAVIPGRDPVHDVVGDMIQKDGPVRDAAKQIEPEVATFGGENCVDFHGARFVIGRISRSHASEGRFPRLSCRDIKIIPRSGV